MKVVVGEERKENVRRNGQPELTDTAGGVREERKIYCGTQISTVMLHVITSFSVAYRY